MRGKNQKKERVTINKDVDFTYSDGENKAVAIVCWILGILVCVAVPIALLLYYYL